MAVNNNESVTTQWLKKAVNFLISVIYCIQREEKEEANCYEQIGTRDSE